MARPDSLRRHAHPALLLRCFDWVNVALAYSRTAETTFRPDREIKRGRV